MSSVERFQTGLEPYILTKTRIMREGVKKRRTRRSCVLSATYDGLISLFLQFAPRGQGPPLLVAVIATRLAFSYENAVFHLDFFSKE